MYKRLKKNIEKNVKKNLKSKLNHMQCAQLNLTLSLIKNVTIMFFFYNSVTPNKQLTPLI